MTPLVIASCRRRSLPVAEFPARMRKEVLSHLDSVATGHPYLEGATRIGAQEYQAPPYAALHHPGHLRSGCRPFVALWLT